MRYLRVEWHHDFPEEPVKLYSEIDDEGYELRKVQVFRDERLERADAETETAATGLSEVPIGPVEEIDAQEEFSASTITRAEFEHIWSRAAGPGDEPGPVTR
ncbi:hypothetical protein DP939_31415 [Spongiactinospora rosea]|uniref:DUF6881 domain-containing protein n=1 Tax=Spongiactinospora rosea TaxID=2248750 RepID=A0A366LSR5_9ACTN|nr:hypothetical protein DP939_31415 [Spongiactinospora rosea]